MRNHSHKVKSPSQRAMYHNAIKKVSVEETVKESLDFDETSQPLPPQDDVLESKRPKRKRKIAALAKGFYEEKKGDILVGLFLLILTLFVGTFMKDVYNLQGQFEGLKILITNQSNKIESFDNKLAGFIEEYYKFRNLPKK